MRSYEINKQKINNNNLKNKTMKQNLLNKLWLRVCMIVAIMTTALTASAAEEVYSTCLFGADYNQQSVGSYTDTWTASNEDFEWTIVNGNNNKNGWNYVKFGRKNNASVGEIVTSAAYSVAITKVAVTIDAITVANVNSIKLYTSADNSAWTEAGSFTKAAGIQTVNLASPATNLYYKVEFDCASGSANGLVTVSKVEYYYNTGGATAPSISAGNLSIAYNATVGEIEYAVSNPVTGGTLSASTTSDWLELGDVDDDLIPFECDANDGVERTATITLTYTYGSESVTANVTVTQAANPNGPGTEANPYTVAQARAAIDAGTGTQGVYATGIVSAIPTAWSSEYNNITFNFVDATGDELFLQAYRCGGAEAADVQVGDIVVVKGNLTKYNTTYEFAAACELVSLTHPTVAVEAPTFSPAAGTYTEAQSVTLSSETSGATIYYTTDGTEPTTESTQYTAAIAVSTTTTIKAIAVKGSDVSTVASATYAILAHAGTEADPYTVVDAHAAIDANAGLTDVYATGIVTEIPTAWSAEHSNITFNFVDATGDEIFLQAYRCASTEAADASTVQVGDIVVVKGTLKKYNDIYEFGQGCQLVSLTHNGTPADPVIVAENATIAADVTYYELMYSIENPVEGTSLTATKDAAWITSITPSEKSFDRVMIECTANESAEARTATITLTYGTATKEVTLTQEGAVAPVEDYVTLPYSWAGGTKDALLAETGVTASGLGTDYAESNAPYRVKFDTTGDYIQFKTDSRPGVVTIEVKMLGGANTSTITVQESADGETFTDVQELTISGAQNDVLTLSTTTEFAETSRYVRLYFTKGSNVGVGPISIAAYAPIVLSDYTLTIADPENVTITANYGGETILQNGENAEVTEGTEVTVALSIAEGYDLESVTVNGTADGQAVTLSPGTVEGVYTFTMPAYDVTVNATAVEQETPPTPGTEEWVEVALDELTADDVFVIVGNNGSNYAMSNNNGTTSAPAAVAVTVTGNKITSTVADNIKWNISSDATGYTFYPDGETETWLYCTNTNNGVRVGAGDAKHFTVDKGYLTTTETDDQRYLGIYNSQDWRCYKLTNEGAIQTNIAGQTFKFYKKVGDAPTVQTLTVTAARYATMVAEANLEIPADVLVEVFAIQTHDSYATLLPVTGNIPAGEAVLVKADAGEYNFAYAQEADPITVNELVGATEDVVADGTQYILANGGEGIGFYKATTGSTIKAGKAYLVVPAGIKGFYGFDEDDATGISDLNANVNANEAIYNLAGQRIQKMQRGINIVGGKKVLK